MYSFTCPQCGEVHNTGRTIHELEQNINLTAIIERLAEQIYLNRIPENQTNVDLATFTASVLWQDVLHFWRADLDMIKPATTDMRWINRIHNNLYAFSGAKSFCQMEEMRNAVFAGDGSIRPYTEYRLDILNINSRYNETWLETEHNATVRGTVMGSQWLDIQDNKEFMPYLQYQTAGDNRVREDHAQLNKIIEPVDSRFWDKYFPPNGWNCRCGVIQLSERQARHLGYKPDLNLHMKIATASINDKYWCRNTGTIEIFNLDKIPYFEAVPGRGKKQMKAINYGLKPVEKIYLRTDLPSLNLATASQFDSWWLTKSGPGGKIIARDVLGFNVEFDMAFKENIVRNGHQETIQELFKVLQDPDEIWEGLKTDNHDGWFRKYIRYYDKKPVVLMIDENGMPQSFSGVDDAENFRTGVLIKVK